MDLSTLTTQRWFAGKDRPVADLELTDGVAGLGFADVTYADGDRERYLVADDDVRWSPLLTGLLEQSVTGAAGRLELRADRSLEEALRRAGEGQRHASMDQSNTLIVLGDALLIKLYRTVRPGRHPEAETLAALAGDDRAPVPAWRGELVLVDAAGQQTTLGLLQDYVAQATSGWEALIAPLAARLRGETSAGGPPLGEAGRATGVLHETLAAAFGVVRDPAARAVLRDRARAALDAVGGQAPGLDRAGVTALRRRVDALGRVEDPVLQRIHGDLNAAQLLFTDAGPLIVDFEGDPLVAFADRRAPDTPLRDLATFLRSLDHIATAGRRRAERADDGGWSASVRAAVLDSYAATTGQPIDLAVLDALEIEAECRELVYAARYVPEWAYVAEAGLADLLDTPPPVPR